MAYFRSFDSLKKHFQSLLDGLPTDAPAVNAIPDSPSEPVHVLYVACKWVQRVPPDEQLTTFFGSFLKGTLQWHHTRSDIICSALYGVM